MMKCSMRRRQCILLSMVVLIVYLIALIIFQNFQQPSTERTRLLDAYEDLLMITNALRVPVVVVDAKILNLVSSLLTLNEGKTNNVTKKESMHEKRHIYMGGSLDGSNDEEDRQNRRKEFNDAIEKISLDVISIATYDVFLRNKKLTLNELSAAFSVLPLPSDYSSAQTLFHNSHTITNKNPHHYILSHKRLKVNFHLVVFRSFGSRYYIVDQIDGMMDGRMVDGKVDGMMDGLVLDSLQYGSQHLAVFESKALQTQVHIISGTLLRIPKDIPKFIRAKSESRFIECNKTITERFKMVNAVKLTDKAFKRKLMDGLFVEGALDLLERVSSVLYALGVPFWLSSGTCLGWLRQCDMIPYSRDVDVGVFIKDHHPSIIHHLQTYGLSLTHSFGMVNDSYELSFSNGYLKLDIFFFYEEDKDDGETRGDDSDARSYDNSRESFVWNGGTDVFTSKKYKYVFRKFNLCWTYFFEKLMVRVPCETEGYIEDNYGKGWMEVVEGWDWKRSPSNVLENGVWSEADVKCCVKLYT